LKNVLNGIIERVEGRQQFTKFTFEPRLIDDGLTFFLEKFLAPT